MQLSNLSDDIKIDVITMLLQSLKHDTNSVSPTTVSPVYQRKRLMAKDRSLEEWNNIFEGKDVEMSEDIDFSTNNFVKAHSGKIIIGKIIHQLIHYLSCSIHYFYRDFL